MEFLRAPRKKFEEFERFVRGQMSNSEPVDLLAERLRACVDLEHNVSIFVPCFVVFEIKSYICVTILWPMRS